MHAYFAETATRHHKGIASVLQTCQVSTAVANTDHRSIASVLQICQVSTVSIASKLQTGQCGKVLASTDCRVAIFSASLLGWYSVYHWRHKDIASVLQTLSGQQGTTHYRP